jgi:hypothetical protein
MLLSEVSDTLYRRGYFAPETSIAVAVASGQIEKPPFDKQNRLDFSEHHVEQLARLFRKRPSQTLE